jgi:hypothetical protein
MDDETRRLLRQNLDLAKENNRILRKLRRDAVLGNILRIVWWAILIGVPVYLYLTIFQPYLQELGATYEGIRADVEGLQTIPESFKAFLDGLFPGSTE